MEFRFTPEEEAFRAEVRNFVRSEVPEGWEDQFDLETPEGADAAHEYSEEFMRKLAQRGWLAMHWPREYGGQDAPLWKQVVYQEELNLGNAPDFRDQGLSWVGPGLMIHGSGQQKRAHLPAIAAHKETWCTLYSEPNAGSDLASLTTTAARSGDEWVINGQKIWITLAHRKDWGWLAARTDANAPRHKGISIFIVPMNTPGIATRPIISMAGMHRFNEVFLQDVRIPLTNLVGEENRGWYQMAVALDLERAAIAGNLSRIRRDWRDLLSIWREFGIVSPVLRSQMAEIEIEVTVAQGLVYRVLSAMQAGAIPNAEASIAKLFCVELHQKVSDLAMRTLGLLGQVRSGSAYAVRCGRIARNYLHNVSHTISGGTSEIMRNIIAQRGLKLPR